MWYFGFFIAFLGLLGPISAAPEREKRQFDDVSLHKSCREIFNISCIGVVPVPLAPPSPPTPLKRELPRVAGSDCKCVPYYMCSDNGKNDCSATPLCPEYLQVACEKSSIISASDAGIPSPTPAPST